MNNNYVSLIGNLTKDPVLRKTMRGDSVTNFTIGVWRAKNKTDFINVSVWGNLAEYVSNNCRKGNQVMVCGSLHIDKGKDDKYYTQVQADFVGRSEWKREPDEVEEEPADYSKFKQEMDEDIPY